MKETEFTERELTIMTESFVVGRMYGLMRKQESDDEILKLKAELVECHNKNTELKGDIARGNTKLKAENDSLQSDIGNYLEMIDDRRSRDRH